MVLSVAIKAPVTTSHCILAPLRENRVGYSFATREIWIIQSGQQTRTSRLISLDLNNHSSCSVRTKTEYYRSCDNFVCLAIDKSATGISFLTIIGCHPQPTGGLVESLCSMYSTAPANRVGDFKIQTDDFILPRRPDRVLIKRKKKLVIAWIWPLQRTTVWQ